MSDSRGGRLEGPDLGREDIARGGWTFNLTRRRRTLECIDIHGDQAVCWSSLGDTIPTVNDATVNNDARVGLFHDVAFAVEFSQTNGFTFPRTLSFVQHASLRSLPGPSMVLVMLRTDTGSPLLRHPQLLHRE